MEQEIFDLAVTFLEDSADHSALDYFCKAAFAQLRAGLKPQFLPEDCRDAFVPAAAWLALGFYNHTQGADGVSAFSVGDMSLTKNTEQQRQLALQAERLMAPYLRGEMAFLGVVG